MGLLEDFKPLEKKGEGSYLRQQFPSVYGALAGLLGTAPDEIQGSVMDGNTAAARNAAESTYLPGLLASSLPFAKAGMMLAIDPKAQKQFVAGLLSSGSKERYRLGDLKQKQAADAYVFGGKPVSSSLDVFASPDILEDHARLGRIARENFTGDEVGLYANQAMRPNSKVFQPLKDGDYPLLTSEKIRDPVSGRLYNAEMALKPVDDGFEAITIIPRGLKARKKP